MRCQRVEQFDRVCATEAVGELPDVACNQGFPRLPVGDSHEAFTLRLCYLALLVQTLLSWDPASTIPNDSDYVSNVLKEPCLNLWMTDKVRLPFLLHLT